jgi:hypothetical protein
MGELQLVEILSRRPTGSMSTLIWIATWDVVAFVAALVLLEATVRVFDRKFDRVPEWVFFQPPRRRLERKGILFLEDVVVTPAETLASPGASTP